MLWPEGCLHLWMRFPSPTRTPTQLAVYCVLQIYLSDVWWWILRLKQCPIKCIQICWEIFDKLLCYYIWTLFYIRTRRIIMDFLFIKICSDYHLNSIYIYYCWIWKVVFCCVIMFTICVYCKFVCIVLCIADIFVWCLVVNSSGETVPPQLYPSCWDISINFCVIKFGHYILFGQA